MKKIWFERKNLANNFSIRKSIKIQNNSQELPKFLFRLSNLQRLGLSDNDVHYVPADIQQLRQLVELNLSRNGPSFEEFGKKLKKIIKIYKNVF